VTSDTGSREVRLSLQSEEVQNRAVFIIDGLHRMKVRLFRERQCWIKLCILLGQDGLFFLVSYLTTFRLSEMACRAKTLCSDSRIRVACRRVAKAAWRTVSFTIKANSSIAVLLVQADPPIRTLGGTCPTLPTVARDLAHHSPALRPLPEYP
jgi:hypothetical protein